MDASYVVLRYNQIGTVTESYLAHSNDEAKKWANINTSRTEYCIIYKAQEKTDYKEVISINTL